MNVENRAASSGHPVPLPEDVTPIALGCLDDTIVPSVHAAQPRQCLGGGSDWLSAAA
jgi:hypothetical protein